MLKRNSLFVVIACAAFALTASPAARAQEGDLPPVIYKNQRPQRRVKVGRAEVFYFRGARVVRLMQLELQRDTGEALYVDMSFDLVGRRPAAPSVVHVTFARYSSSAQFGDDAARKVSAVADGATLDLGQFDYSVFEGMSGVPFTEIMGADVSFKTIARLASSKSAALRLGGREVALTGEHLSALRDLVEAAKR
ncbi:MAG TPA: hypothetical protein VD968_01370 [Pyrinomonadaceae bacterium]|nr:hypothetical protein [Pyrinomonadaceae bacterium]